MRHATGFYAVVLAVLVAQLCAPVEASQVTRIVVTPSTVLYNAPLANMSVSFGTSANGTLVGGQNITLKSQPSGVPIFQSAPSTTPTIAIVSQPIATTCTQCTVVVAPQKFELVLKPDTCKIEPSSTSVDFVIPAAYLMANPVIGTTVTISMFTTTDLEPLSSASSTYITGTQAIFRGTAVNTKQQFVAPQNITIVFNLITLLSGAANDVIYLQMAPSVLKASTTFTGVKLTGCNSPTVTTDASSKLTMKLDPSCSLAASSDIWVYMVGSFYNQNPAAGTSLKWTMSTTKDVVPVQAEAYVTSTTAPTPDAAFLVRPSHVLGAFLGVVLVALQL